MSDPVAVVVYGATGYTGKLICAELKRAGVSFAISGRDAGKLQALATQLGGAIEVVPAGIDDPAALEKMAARGRVVLDCAGPFARLGRPVQNAALAAGRHFLDITGEHTYMRETFARDEEAKRRGVALVNSVGFDVVPTDAAAVLAAEAAGAPVGELRIAFHTAMRPSQGTARSALEAAEHGGLAFVDGEYRVEPVGAERWEVPFPQPLGARECISVPWGDVATAPRSTGARVVRTYIASSRGMAAMTPLLGPLGSLFRLGPVKALGERLVRSMPEGPTDDERTRDRFAVYAEAEGAKGNRGVWVKGGNGYDFTASSAVLCAKLAAAPDFAPRGSLTPAQAFGARALLDGLQGAGVEWGFA
jgi:saccharopine dehydrogenase (NAD+, L-lysine-forming)